MYDAEGKFIGSKCDLEKCKGMTAEECTAYCDKMGCTPEQKAACLKMIEANANKH
jgi:K(+)-stimulated pyrophosphate-energized sodium pump